MVNLLLTLFHQHYRLLEAKVKRLEGIIEILKKANCRISDPLKERLDALEELGRLEEEENREFNQVAARNVDLIAGVPNG